MTLLTVLFALAPVANTPGVTVTLPMVDDGVMLKIPAVMVDQPCNFILDSGCSITIIDRPLIDRLGPSTGQVIAESPYQGDITLNVYHPPVIRVAGWRLPLTRVASANLEIARLICGNECSGVLGMDLLSRYVVTLNFEKEQFSISSANTKMGEPNQTVVPMIPLKEKRFAIKAILNSSACLTLAIDSGSSTSVSLSPGDWNTVFGDRSGTIGRVSFFAGVGNNVRANQTVRVKTLRIGNNVYTNLLCSRLSNPASVSHIGLGLLRRNLVALDFLHQKLSLVARTNMPDEQDDMSGLHLLLENGLVTVYAVDSDSPADRAGIKAGDTIFSLDGNEASQLQMQQIRQLLQQKEGMEIDAVVGRNGKSFSTSFFLKSLI